MLSRRKFFILTLLLIILLPACSGELLHDPTPIPPPPTASGNQLTTTASPTPQASEQPAETAAAATPSLSPTATATEEARETAVTDPPLQVIAGQPLPSTSRDLLFLADGAFKQWSHATGQIETIVAGPNPANRIQDEVEPKAHVVGDITGYALNADGKRAVLARLLEIGADSTANSQPGRTYELLFVDMISREVWTLVPQVANLDFFQLSPDAQQLAFTATGLADLPDSSTTEPPPTHIYVMATGGGNPGPVRRVYDCQPRCLEPNWHGESNLVAFGDDAALWLYNIAASDPEMLLENRGFTPGMTDVGDISVFSPIEWANNGRYLLLWHGRWEGGSRAVLDVPTRAFVPVPDSFVYADLFPSEVSWMPDDRLLVWRTRQDGTEAEPLAELWRFDLAGEALNLEESARLSEGPAGVLGGTSLINGRFAFALAEYPSAERSTTTARFAGTYWLTSLAEAPERVNSLPPARQVYLQTRVFWANDGSGALLVQEPRQFQPEVYYAPSTGSFLYEITAVLGQNPHQFLWQPEITVP